jgi:Mg-chelatase subunit ChlD
MSINNFINKFGNFLNSRDQQLPLPHTKQHEILHDPNEVRIRIIIIDASGSMFSKDWKPSRLKAAQEAAKAFAERLMSEDPDAYIAVIAYGSCATLLIELTAARKLNRLFEAIDSISDLGSTNITAGLEIASHLLESNRSLGQIVLLTDGHHNTGHNPKSTSDKLKELAIIECIGIGGTPKDVDERLLKYIASSYPDGSKRYRWIGDKEKLVQHFHNLAGRIVRA